ncbi:DUF6684 family protein [Halocatena marina]|uniref:DUF6684 family protein n=1 Tax=Halocatena marina TaxID=2934937 RepID=A0ABD5YXW2_9EURY|nr:DUF6684 family protein [Halocatena marina]
MVTAIEQPHSDTLFVFSELEDSGDSVRVTGMTDGVLEYTTHNDFTPPHKGPPMGRYALNRETLLDVTVNIIPLFIILFYLVLFIVYDPYRWEPLIIGVSLILLIIPFVLLALVTYIAGRTIEQEETQQQ